MARQHANILPTTPVNGFIVCFTAQTGSIDVKEKVNAQEAVSKT